MSRSFEVLTEWVKQPPEGWEPRLRIISPIVDRTSHLRFRYRTQYDMWELYEATPAHLLSEDRVTQLTRHWSELPKDQQYARKRYVTEYQHYMFRTHKVEVRRFWVLQGEMGGTPAEFTERETKLLESVGAPSEPPMLGMLEACPFDQRAVEAILKRDLLLKNGGDLDALKKSRTALELKIQDDENEKDYRRSFLGWYFEQMLPCSDFMKTFLRTKEADNTLRKATREESDLVSQWRDHFIETGIVLGAGQVTNRAVQIAVA